MRKIREFIKNISPFNNRTDMPKILYVIKVIIIFFVFKFISELVGEALAIGIHFACGKNPLQGEMFDGKTIMLITYLGYGIMTGILILMWKLFQKKTISELGFTKNAGSYLAGALAGAVLVVVSTVIVILTGTIEYKGLFGSIDRMMVSVMLVCFIFQGAMEEILCRGIVQGLLQKNTSVPVAIAVSSVLFTIPHISSMDPGKPAITAAAVINLLLISFIFSLITLHFKSIWAACGMHSIWNYILYSIMGLNLSGNDEIVSSVFDLRSVGGNVLNGGMYGIEASIVTTAVLSAFAALLFMYHCKIFKAG